MIYILILCILLIFFLIIYIVELKNILNDYINSLDELEEKIFNLETELYDNKCKGSEENS